jgi:hypothetical protein
MKRCPVCGAGTRPIISSTGGGGGFAKLGEHTVVGEASVPSENSDPNVIVVVESPRTGTGHLAEREACAHLFAGAIGMFKNPANHRHVGSSVDEARELIFLANYLLRLVEGFTTAS